ncbi:CubicO group peptidase, beta-lactamase class C family [Dyella sp. OK004]|uniref:serine hydrolase domain-containing protein n=1 Tax=Dyella sp. OK004 TaxID=1855292 RepID=UPI0008F12AFD|nr:serine hydrolase domain-containing protein [Dyella sp. OK004]SFR92869.1 CubicO group peptidase, beta-lactamase class C family [Dyella sp. OK004]
MGKSAALVLSVWATLSIGLPAQAAGKMQQGPMTLERALTSMQAKSILPGYCVAVVDGGGVRYAKGFGYADITQRRPYTADTPQPVGSISKTLIGVSAMQLVESGALTLDADVNTALPFAVRNPGFAATPITLRQLATHTSSITDREPFYNQSYVKGAQTAFDIKTFLQSYLDPKGASYQPANFIKARPGSTYKYSNLGATLAALMIETKARTTYRAYTQEHIFDPLRMQSTGWAPGEIKQPGATLYDKQRNPMAPYTSPSYPDGGLITTCNDLGRFLSAMIRGYQGQPGLLKPASFHQMFTPQWPKQQQPKGVRPGGGLDDAFFWQRSVHGELGHSGGDQGITAEMRFNSITSTGRILITNISDIDRKDVARELDSIWLTLGKYEQSPEP